jgi:hypothetical protein
MGLIVVLEIDDAAGFQFVVDGSEDAAIVYHDGMLVLIAVGSEVTPHQFDDVGRDTMRIFRIETRKNDGLDRHGRSMRLLVEPGIPCLLLLDWILQFIMRVFTHRARNWIFHASYSQWRLPILAWWIQRTFVTGNVLGLRRTKM